MATGTKDNLGNMSVIIFSLLNKFYSTRLTISIIKFLFLILEKLMKITFIIFSLNFIEINAQIYNSFSTSMS